MAEPQLVDQHDPVMTGENSFVRLSGDGGKTFAERTSHWRVLWSPAGQGHVLFIESALTGKTPRIYADNVGVARYLQRTIEILLHKPFADESLQVIDADFTRTGNSLSTVDNPPTVVELFFLPKTIHTAPASGFCALKRPRSSV